MKHEIRMELFNLKVIKKRDIYRFLRVGFLTLFVLIASCNNDSKKGGEAGGAINHQQSSGSLGVRIIPEAPTSSDDLCANTETGRGAVFSWEKNGVILENEHGSRLSRKLFAKNDRIKVIAVSGKEKGSATVSIGNSPPTVVSVSFVPVDIRKGVDVTAVSVSSDADGDVVRFDYKWSINGKEITENSNVLTRSRFKKGDRISLELIPSDGDNAGASCKTQDVTVQNSSPLFESNPSLNFGSRIYTYKAVARDPDGDPVTYSLGSAPQGMRIDARSGLITWRIKHGDEGDHPVEVIACDSENAEAVQKYSLHIRMDDEIPQ